MDASAYAFGLRRVAAIGSVDDGKSTLIGRLLYDTGNVYDDQLAAVEKSSRRKGKEGIDLSFITDGLAAEREQGITIDVAYRYVTTPTHRFILADAPGHEEYTRNMVTAAAGADTAVVLTDVAAGPTLQTVRHLYLAHLFGVRQLIVAVNKMDQVGYAQDGFGRIRDAVAASLERMGVQGVAFIPVSALAGDMVAHRGERLPWYGGPTLLEAISRDPATAAQLDAPFRMCVQTAVRAGTDFRGYAGTVAAGRLRVGDAVVVLPSGRTSAVTRILLDPHGLPEARWPQAVVVTLADDVGVSRGDVLVRGDESARPRIGDALAADVCWMSEHPLAPGATYLIKHGTRTTKATVTAIDHRIDMRTVSPVPAESLTLNDVGALRMAAHEPLVYDAYRDNRTTGAILMIDPLSKATVGVGLIRHAP